ncbi:endoribonuclease YbeY [Cyanobium sp.]|jgi:probable rRNA maturation factor|nr:endoribonuclease YbeY [Cyanobium sp.]
MSAAIRRKADEPEVDLAFELGDGLALELGVTAGALTSPETAEEGWSRLLARWLAELSDEIPATWRRSAYSLGLQLCDDEVIAILNSTWRHRNEPTDVLSFAALERGLEDGPSLPLPLPAGPFETENQMKVNGWEREALDDARGLAWEFSGEPLELGDIVISLESAARQAAAAGTSLEAELQFLASHGLLHLLGWDHPDEASLATMLSRQEALITGA